MTNLIHKTGDIFTSHAQAIGHGVNIDGVMGSGIAVQFRDRFPQMYQAYKVLCTNGSLRPGATMIWEVPAPPSVVWDTQYVYNIASQDRPGPNARIDWLATGVRAAIVDAEKNGVQMIALPRIGSGVGGLDADRVEQVLTELAESGPVDIEIWTLPR